MSNLQRVLVLVLGLALAFAPQALADGKIHKWEIATLAPEGFGWGKHGEDIMIRGTTLATEGNLSIKMHWAGVKGDDEDYLRLMKAGEIQGAGLSGQGASLACPEFGIVELPFMFRDYDEVDYVREKMFGEFDARFARYGLKLLYWVDQDFDQIYSTSSPLATLDDFKKARFVLWYGPLEDALFCSLGAKSVPLNVPDNAAALRTGKVNAIIAPAAWMVGAQLQNVVKYVNPVKVRYSPVAVVVTRTAWDDFPKNFQKMYEQERDKVTKDFTKLVRKDNDKSLAALEARGVKRTNMDPESLEAFKKRASMVCCQMTDIAFPRDLLLRLEAYLEEFRAAKKAQ